MRFLGSVVTVALLSSLTFGQAPDKKHVPKSLRGVWVVTHRAYQPSDATQAAGDILTKLGFKVEFKPGQVKALDDGAAGYSLQVEFAPTESPKQIDFTVPDTGKVLRGIYRLEDGVLNILVGPGDDRPGSFSNTADQILLVLKRPKS